MYLEETMERLRRWFVPIAACMLTAACSTTPERIDSLVRARTLVSQVEASPRAGVAAIHLSAARDSLSRAERLVDEGGNRDDIEFEAEIATLNAQIALEKIKSAQLREDIDESTAERQAVLLKARERELRRQSEEARAAEARAKTLEQELQALRAKPTPRGMVLTLDDVLFDFGEAALKPGAFRTIDRVAEALKREEDRRVIIEGHTDSVGSDIYNQSLSQRRADAVRAALLVRGVRPEQVRVVGKGEEVPIASNQNPGGRQENRRVELIFTDVGSHVATDGT
jgi:OmpA-OmpF porin, OOP family